MKPTIQPQDMISTFFAVLCFNFNIGRKATYNYSVVDEDYDDGFDYSAALNGTHTSRTVEWIGFLYRSGHLMHLQSMNPDDLEAKNQFSL